MKCSMYYNRPASELIFLPRGDHMRLHALGRPFSKATRKKIAVAHAGKHHSKATRKKMSQAQSGEKNPFFGKTHSDEARKRMSQARLGFHWYNDGVKSVLARSCPEGFTAGRAKRLGE